MLFSRQECWSGFPFPPPGDLPNPGIKPTFPALEGGFFTTESPGKPRQLEQHNFKIIFSLKSEQLRVKRELMNFN